MNGDITTMKQFEARLVAWCKVAAPACPVVFENQNAPRPTKAQFITLYGPRTMPEDEVSEFVDGNDNDGNLVINATEQLAIYITITAHGDGDTETAQDLANRLRRQIRQFYAREFFEPAAVVDTQQVMQVPQLLESQFENRFQFDVQFRLGMQDQFVIESVQSVQGAGTIRGSTPSINVPIDVTLGD